MLGLKQGAEATSRVAHRHGLSSDFDGDFWVLPVQVVQVHVIRLQPLQGPLDGFPASR